MRKAKRKKKSSRRPKKRVTKRATKRAAKRKASKTRRGSSARSVTRRQKEPVPVEPAGRIGIKRPSNQPKPPGAGEPRELARAEPDARFDDRRLPEDDARDPAATERETGRPAGYKNTDESF